MRFLVNFMSYLVDSMAVYRKAMAYVQGLHSELMHLRNKNTEIVMTTCIIDGAHIVSNFGPQYVRISPDWPCIIFMKY